jgi:SOS response regulatory protein OraA/RecX
LLDDERVARHRAAALAERGWGDEAIRHRLVEERLEPGAVDGALRELEPESIRAGRIVGRRGVGPATARFLARRGFGEDAVEAAAGQTA